MSEFELGPDQYSVAEESGFALYSQLKRFFERVNVVYVVLGVCGFFFVAAYLMGGTKSVGALVSLGANFGRYIDRGEYWRLLTSLFLHAGMLHLFVNGYSFFILGRFIESVYGKLRLLSVFLFAGVCASLSSASMAGQLSVGASGGIAGLLGLALSFTVRFRESLNPKFKRNFLINIAVVLAINVFIAASYPGVDNWAHLGGFLAGMACGFITWPERLFGKRTSGKGVFATIMVLLALVVFSYVMLVRYLFVAVVFPDKSSSVVMRSQHKPKFQVRYPAAFDWRMKMIQNERLYHFTNYYNYSIVVRFFLENEYKTRIYELARLNAVTSKRTINGMAALAANGKEYANGRPLYFYQLIMKGPAGTTGKGVYVEMFITAAKPIKPAQQILVDRMAASFFFVSRGVL